MASVKDIFTQVASLAPLNLQMEFDNSGFLVGSGKKEVHRVLLSLDITVEVIEEAAELGCELIVSHHPVIFDGLKNVTDDGSGNKVCLLLEKGIAAICMHTNLDIAEGGVNDVLIRMLGCEPEDAVDPHGCGRIGTLPVPRPMSEFLPFVKERLQSKGLRYWDAGKPVSRLAVLGGAGGDELCYAIAKGCDTYVTADVKYHIFLDAAEKGINLIDADHFCTENPVMHVLKERLQRAFPDVTFSLSQRHGQVVSFI